MPRTGIVRSLGIIAALSLTSVLGASETGKADGFCDCSTLCSGIIEVTLGTAETTYYIDDRNNLNVVPFNGVWLYEESNGVWHGDGTPGLGEGRGNLQRGGASGYIPEIEDICYDTFQVAPDSLILGA